MSVWYWQGTREAGRPLRPLLTESVPAYSFHSFCVRKWKKSCKNHLRSQSYGTHDSKPLKRKIERKIPFSCAFFSLHFKEFYSSLRTAAATGEETDNLCILLAIYYFCLLQNSGRPSFRVGQIRISLGFRFSKKIPVRSNTNTKKYCIFVKLASKTTRETSPQFKLYCIPTFRGYKSLTITFEVSLPLYALGWLLYNLHLLCTFGSSSSSWG